MSMQTKNAVAVFNFICQTIYKWRGILIKVKKIRKSQRFDK